MRTATYFDRKLNFQALGVVGLVLIYISGCSNVGPESISAGRLHYAEAINTTEDQQMLLSIVKGRYGETSSLLVVSGVAANIRFSARAGIEAGFSAGAAQLGENLITGTLAYEENPTITYAPIQGEKYVRQIMVPLPLDILILGLRSSTFKRPLFTLLVSRINNLSNPNFINSEEDNNSQFARFVEIFTELSNADIIEFLADKKEKTSFYMLIRELPPEYVPKINELLALLDLKKPKGSKNGLIIPIYFSERPKNNWGIGITTRSTFDIVEVFRAAVDVPEEHLRAGIVIEYPPVGLAGKGVVIKSSTDKPTGRSPAVYYRGYWFFINDTDRPTKAAYALLRSMWSITISSSADQKNVPFLTLPVNQ